MISIVDKVVELHRVLTAADVPHAFGGALALAWCTDQARGTVDIDLNIFLDRQDIELALDALPQDVQIDPTNREQLKRDGQTRLWWKKTPVDLFFNTTPFHVEVAGRARLETFSGEAVPFLACRDIAVFKAFFSRDKDWTDLRSMARANMLDYESVIGVLALYLGGDDDRIEQLRAISQQFGESEHGTDSRDLRA